MRASCMSRAGSGGPQRKHERQAARAGGNSIVVRQSPPAVGALLHPREELIAEERVLLERFDAQAGPRERPDDAREGMQPDVLDAHDRRLGRAVEAARVLADM